MRKPEWLEEMEHTADVGISVRAGSLPKLFERAGWGLFFLITDIEQVRPAREESVTVQGTDREDLMARWLSELVFRHETRHWLFCRFKVDKIDENSVAARVAGEPIDQKRHAIHRAVKAVTYHGLAVAREGDGFRANVILDV